LTERFRYRQFPAGNPLANILVVAVGAILIAISFVLGIVAIVALAATLAVMAAIIGVRVWWLNRHMRGSRQHGAGTGAGKASGPTVIEGEFRVVDNRDRGEPGNRT